VDGLSTLSLDNEINVHIYILARMFLHFSENRLVELCGVYIHGP
jgi:hypothetical protein